jgi:hypothetical protein
VSDPDPVRELYEVRLALAGECRLVRLRAESLEAARAIIADHYPGWDLRDVHRWVGEGWVVAAAAP